MAKIIYQVGEYKISLVKNPYRSLIDSIITQQLSGAAADSISKKFQKIYQRYPKPVEVINTSDSKLRAAGLSKMKVDYIKDLSEKIQSKELRLRSLRDKSDEEVISHLTQVKGIGRWTAEMFLIFSLGRLDVLPVGDLGLKKGIQRLYSMPDLPEKEEIEKIAEKWRPYRTVATWYIWKSLNQFGKIG
ncbi:DNA-3-methyladenine glycosylase family protein [Candidatus Nitrosotenuis sp. DW1]|uniref:DNA-3-methyladenine glycosylase family protein n=1 Tax=Candidatus Nitrosotenuis sp. DW1 TaxID=2259672 RepID=UPI0015CE6CEA|nr:DNA-3-methyladenine glycosylase [Candidatus Nitrosotenuis sp. DW1]QLH10073.1 DNA-3-methyladenine glycosylase 2 family protein [Candidatus Nitrosotenuis sp. DW1]